MKNLFLLTFLALFISIPLSSFSQRPAKAQKKFFPKELRKKGVYFGMPKVELLRAFSDAKANDGFINFRKVYTLKPLSKRFQESQCYLDSEGYFPLYEFILIIADGYSNETIARELFGPPNFNETKWLFKPADTGLDFEISAWTFQNKLIIAGALPGTEWEEGFDN